VENIDFGPAAIDRYKRQRPRDQRGRQPLDKPQLVDMRKRCAARLVSQSARPVKGRLIGLVRSLGSFTPTDDSIGVTIRVLTRCTERRKKTCDHRLGSCVKIYTGCLGNEIHKDTGPAETETKLAARRALRVCCALGVWRTLSVCCALSVRGALRVCRGLSVLWNGELVCGEFETC